MSAREIKPYMNGGVVPTNCAYCRQPFPLEGSHLRAWRGKDGQLFCNEFCAEGGESAPTRKVS